MIQKMYKLLKIKKMVNKINKDLGLPENKLPAYGFDYGYRNTYVTVSKDGYSLIAFGHYRDEKNNYLLVKTLDINELIFEIFNSATHRIAFDYELKNRIPDQDCRIIAFNKHIEILSSLQLERKFVDKLKERYDYLLHLNGPEPLPDNWL